MSNEATEVAAPAWPKTISCEKGACGKRINTDVDQFSVLDISGNVIKRKGDGTKARYVAGKFVVCSRCSKKVAAMFRRRNKNIGLEGDQS